MFYYRFIIHLIKGVSPNVTIDALYSFTNCEISISPNCCVINNNKPEFISVNDLLKISTSHTVSLLSKELQYKLQTLNDRWHYLTLEFIFIKNKIYRFIEDCESWDSVIDTIFNKLNKYENQLKRQITKDDIIKLTEIKIKRISKYDNDKQLNSIKSVENDIEETANNIKYIKDYTIRYFEHLLTTYGDNRKRKTIIEEFDSISAKSVVIANKKLYANYKEGFIGTKLKKDEFVCKCSNLDDIIVLND